MGRRDSLEAKRQYNRERYWQNREKILAQQKERYDRQREEIISKNQEYYQKNKDKIKARAAEHYKANAETVKRRESNRRLQRKIAALSILGGKCKCGQDHPAALDFHHKDPSTKLFTIGDMIMSTRQVDQETFHAELLKCEILCKNCHAIEHSSWTWPCADLN